MLEKIIVFLLAILIPMHYLGRALFYIDLLLIIVLFSYLFYKEIKIPVFKKNYFIYSIFLFYLFALVINYFNPTIEFKDNIKLLFGLPIIIYVTMYIFDLSNSSKDNFNFFEKVFFYLSSFICMVVFFSFILNIDIISSIKSLKLVNYNDWYYHSKQSLFAISVVFYLNYYVRNKTFFNLLMLSFIYLGTFASHSRTAIITMAFATLVYFLYNIIEKRKLNLKIFFILSILIIISALVVIEISGNKIHNINSFTSSRFNGWLLYLDLIFKDNTLLGYGLQGGVEIKNAGLLSFKHPHNAYIEALFTLGISGFLMLLLLTFFYLANIFKLDIRYDKGIAFTTFISIFINSQGIGTIWGFSSVLITIFLLYLSLIVVRLEENA
jgi:O-antigen ligase